MKKRYRLRYQPYFLVRYVIAEDMISALKYAQIHDIRGTNSYGDVLGWGEIEEITLWDSKLDESQIAQTDEVAA